jgi:hypothetical protein
MVETCSSCGMNIPDDARFCSWCGVSIEAVIVPVAVAPPIASVPVVPPVVPAVPVTSRAVAVTTLTPTLKPLAVPVVGLVDDAQRRLRFCNRCGIRIPFGDAKAYMGLVMCADCFEVEPIPTSIPSVPIPMPIPALA